MAKSDREVEKQDARRAKSEAARQGKSERLGHLRRAEDARVADWGLVDPRQVAGLVRAVTAAGGAVMFSITSDGGAFAVTLYDNGDRERVYIPITADVPGELEYLVSLWE